MKIYYRKYPTTWDEPNSDKIGLDQPSLYPSYALGDSLLDQMTKCIAFELDRGGNAYAAAQALLRDIKAGYIKGLQCS